MHVFTFTSQCMCMLSSNLYNTLLSTYVYHIFDLCIQKHIQDTFHLRCDICPPDNSEDIVWNSFSHNTLILGNLINAINLINRNEMYLVLFRKKNKNKKIKKCKEAGYGDINRILRVAKGHDYRALDNVSNPLSVMLNILYY